MHEKGFVSKRMYVLSLIITVIVTGVLAPFLSAYFEDILRPKPKEPKVYILEDKCAITPLWGTNYVAFKGMIRNKGETQEESIIVRIQVSNPFVHLENNLTTIEENIGSLRAGQTTTFSTPIIGPSADYILHCTITIKVTVFGKTKVWDSAEFTETW